VHWRRRPLRHRVTSPQKGQHGFGSPDVLKICAGGPFALVGADIQFEHSSSHRPVSASSFMVSSISRDAGAGQANSYCGTHIGLPLDGLFRSIPRNTGAARGDSHGGNPIRLPRCITRNTGAARENSYQMRVPYD